MDTIFELMSRKKVQQIFIFVSILSLIMVFFCVTTFATDGYEQITSKDALEKRVATAIANQQTELYIDYTGEDFVNMKKWFKQNFDYENLVTVGGEYAAYNYNGAKYTYWSYSTKKRVKVEISYKNTIEEKAVVDSFVKDYIDKHGLKELSSHEAMKNVHDYLTKNFVYAEGVNNLYTAVNEKTTNCYGYTLLYHLFLEELGIESRTTYGQLTLPHIWNVVKLDGQWYNVDITWDAAKKNDSCFLVSSAKIKNSHKIFGNFIVDCPNDYVVPKVEEVPKVEDTDEVVQPEDNVPTPLPKEEISEVAPKEEEVITPTPNVTPEITPTTPPITNSKEDVTENVEDVTSNEEQVIPNEESVSNSNTSDNTSNSSSCKKTFQKLIKLLKQLQQLKQKK